MIYHLVSCILPAGTFAANILSSIIFFLSILIRTTSNVTPLNCLILKSIILGFCGCLSTISTFIYELRQLPLRMAYFYGIGSILTAEILAFIILGSYSLSGHNIASMC